MSQIRLVESTTVHISASNAPERLIRENSRPNGWRMIVYREDPMPVQSIELSYSSKERRDQIPAETLKPTPSPKRHPRMSNNHVAISSFHSMARSHPYDSDRL